MFQDRSGMGVDVGLLLDVVLAHEFSLDLLRLFVSLDFIPSVELVDSSVHVFAHVIYPWTESYPFLIEHSRLQVLHSMRILVEITG